jgi:hypothetical protein
MFPSWFTGVEGEIVVFNLSGVYTASGEVQEVWTGYADRDKPWKSV